MRPSCWTFHIDFEIDGDFVNFVCGNFDRLFEIVVSGGRVVDVKRLIVAAVGLVCRAEYRARRRRCPTVKLLVFECREVAVDDEFFTDVARIVVASGKCEKC